MRRILWPIPVLLVGGLFAATQLRAQDVTTASSREQLQLLVAQLQHSPDDQVLREKIIKLALTLDPKLPIPDEASKDEGAAEYAFTNAHNTSDYSDAAKQYEKALLIAPWVAADYFNCGVAHEKADENKDAIRNFNLYLIAAPDADDAQAVKKRIGGLQYAAQKVEDAAREQRRTEARQEAVYQGLDGGVWVCDTSYESDDASPWRKFFDRSTSQRGKNTVTAYLEIHGHEMTSYQVGDSNHRRYDTWKSAFESRAFNLDLEKMRKEGYDTSDTGTMVNSVIVTISEDGQTITIEESVWQGLVKFRVVYKRTN